MQLSSTEARVLGSLIEKEITTPEYYPLSLNALLNACNQKTSREPVMQLSNRDVETARRSLEDKDLVSGDHGSRVERYENRARTVFHLRRDETALLCLLLLRGPQTPGELRGRADRMFSFDDIPAVLSALDRLSRPDEDGSGRQGPLVAALPRQAGSREQRFQQLLSEAVPAEGPVAAEGPHAIREERAAAAPKEMSALEERVRILEERMDRLESQLGVRNAE